MTEQKTKWPRKIFADYLSKRDKCIAFFFFLIYIYIIALPLLCLDFSIGRFINFLLNFFLFFSFPFSHVALDCVLRCVRVLLLLLQSLLLLQQKLLLLCLCQFARTLVVTRRVLFLKQKNSMLDSCPRTLFFQRWLSAVYTWKVQTTLLNRLIQRLTGI